jgi:hypothetical protein
MHARRHYGYLLLTMHMSRATSSSILMSLQASSMCPRSCSALAASPSYCLLAWTLFVREQGADHCYIVCSELKQVSSDTSVLP